MPSPYGAKRRPVVVRGFKRPHDLADLDIGLEAAICGGGRIGLAAVDIEIAGRGNHLDIVGDASARLYYIEAHRRGRDCRRTVDSGHFSRRLLLAGAGSTD